MKVFKKVCLFLMISLLAFSLVGCGKEELTVDGINQASAVEEWKKEYYEKKVAIYRTYFETNPEYIFKVDGYYDLESLEKSVYKNILGYIDQSGQKLNVKLKNDKSPSKNDVQAIQSAIRTGSLVKDLTPEVSSALKLINSDVTEFIKSTTIDEKKAKTDMDPYKTVLVSKNPNKDIIRFYKDIFTIVKEPLTQSVKHKAQTAMSGTSTSSLGTAAKDVDYLLQLSSLTGVKIDSKLESELKGYQTSLKSKKSSIEKEKAAKKTQEEAKKKKEDASKKKQEGVRIGMTPEEVRASMWGNPDKINRTTTARGVREQWVYRSKWSGYLYFENGRLVTIQN